MRTPRTALAQHHRLCGLSQESLAASLNVERITVERWESGASTPLPWVRPRLADQCDADPSGLRSLPQFGEESR
jgi:DNA-binding XRE family transcriptional regulator